MAEQLPIACSLTADAAAERLGLFAQLARSALIGAERRQAGIELRFLGGEEVEAALLGFIEAERQCCPFLDFELSRGPELRLRIGGPPDAQPVLDTFLSTTSPT